MYLYFYFCFHRSLAHDEAHKWYRKVLWTGGNFLPGHLGVSVWWRLGSERGTGGMQAAWVWPGSFCPTRIPLWPWLWEDSPGQCALQRWGEPPDSMYPWHLVHSHMWPWRRCRSNLLRWGTFYTLSDSWTEWTIPENGKWASGLPLGRLTFSSVHSHRFSFGSPCPKSKTDLGYFFSL